MDNNIKVCMVTPLFYPLIGGAEEQVRQIASKLIEMGFDIYVVTLKQEGLKRFEHIDGIPVYRILSVFDFPLKKVFKKLFSIKNTKQTPTVFIENRNRISFKWDFVWYIRLISELIKYSFGVISLFFFLIIKRIQIVHCHLLNPYTIVAAAIGKLSRRRVIIKQGSAHETETLQNYFGYFLYKFLAGVSIDVAIAISDECYNELKELGISSDKLVRIPNGVNIEKYCFDNMVNKIVLRKALYPAFSESDKILIFTGSIQFNKGVDILIEAFNSIHIKIPKLKLIIVGRESNHYIVVKGLVEKYELKNKVVFIGETDNVHDYLKSADLFVLPSRPKAEGLSNALLEAMSSGLPVIATKTSGAVDIIENGKNGLLVPPEDPEALKDAIVRILDDEDLAKRLGKNARKTVVNNYSLEKIIKRYVKLYELIVKEKNGYHRNLHTLSYL